MRIQVRWRWALAIAATAVIVSAPTGWYASDLFERNNDFCTGCHAAPGRPLHAALRRDFDAAPARSLAAAHGAARLDRSQAGVPPVRPAFVPVGGDPAAFRCIDCHGGTSPVGRVRVKLLAAKDAFWYLVGRFEEPADMRWTLWDEDCLKCHPAFDESEVRAWQSPRFHQLPVHNTALGVDCVECHRVHDLGGNPEAFFLHAPAVRKQCARCHSEYEEGVG